MDLNETDWQMTHPEPDDDLSVLALMRAYDVAISGEPDTDLDDVHHDWGSIDLTRDAWLVRDDQGALAAYVAMLPHQDDGLRFEIYTAPNLIQSELPGMLLKHCLDQLHAVQVAGDPKEIQRLIAYVLHSNHHYRQIFERAGFKVQRCIYQMRMLLDQAPPEPGWPEGVHVRTFVPGSDDLATYDLVQEAFDRPGREPPSFESWKKHMLRPGSYRPELWKLAFDGDKLVGVCLGFDYPDEGWVRQLGVSESWRGRGLGSALLRDAFVTFYTLGKRKVGLTTESDNPDALVFYKRVGMKVRRQYDEYVRAVPAD